MTLCKSLSLSAPLSSLWGIQGPVWPDGGSGPLFMSCHQFAGLSPGQSLVSSRLSSPLLNGQLSGLPGFHSKNVAKQTGSGQVNEGDSTKALDQNPRARSGIWKDQKPLGPNSSPSQHACFVPDVFCSLLGTPCGRGRHILELENSFHVQNHLHVFHNSQALPCLCACSPAFTGTGLSDHLSRAQQGRSRLPWAHSAPAHGHMVCEVHPPASGRQGQRQVHLQP